MKSFWAGITFVISHIFYICSKIPVSSYRMARSWDLVPEGEVKVMDRSPRCGCVIVMRRITCSRYVTCLPGWPEQPRDLCTNCHTRSGLITLGGERLREKLRSVKHFIIISDGSFQNDTTCNITLVCVICSRHTHTAWEPVATFRPLSPSPQHPSTRIHTGGSLL